MKRTRRLKQCIDRIILQTEWTRPFSARRDRFIDQNLHQCVKQFTKLFFGRRSVSPAVAVDISVVVIDINIVESGVFGVVRDVVFILDCDLFNLLQES